MPPEGQPAGTAQDWLRHARSNLARAKQPKPAEAMWEHLCFDAQQAAEKAARAVLVFRAIDFPYTHEIAELLALLDEAGEPISNDLWTAAAVLTPYAVEARYPSTSPPISEEEYNRAVALAQGVVDWAEASLSRGPE